MATNYKLRTDPHGVCIDVTKRRKDGKEGWLGTGWIAYDQLNRRTWTALQLSVETDIYTESRDKDRLLKAVEVYKSERRPTHVGKCIVTKYLDEQGVAEVYQAILDYHIQRFSLRLDTIADLEARGGELGANDRAKMLQMARDEFMEAVQVLHGEKER